MAAKNPEERKAWDDPGCEPYDEHDLALIRRAAKSRAYYSHDILCGVINGLLATLDARDAEYAEAVKDMARK